MQRIDPNTGLDGAAGRTDQAIQRKDAEENAIVGARPRCRCVEGAHDLFDRNQILQPVEGLMKKWTDLRGIPFEHLRVGRGKGNLVCTI